MVDISVNQTQFRRIRGILERSSDNLKHRCDTGSSGDHAEFTREGRGVGELTLWTLDANLVTDFQEGDVPRDVTLLISLITET